MNYYFFGSLAQSVERMAVNREVIGSSPIGTGLCKENGGRL